MENQTNTPDAFGFAGQELAGIILGNLGLKCNRLSAFQSGGPLPASSSEEALKALGFPEFQRAAAILANPLIKLSAAKGGGALPGEKFSVFGAPQPSGMHFAALLQPGDATLVLYFASQEAFLNWWTGLFACQANSPVINRLLPALPLEEFTFLLHVLDSFRRIYMEGMLLYHPLKDCRISVPDFTASFDVALNSGDIRWLMPALFSMTPGFSGKLLDLQPDLLITAEMLEFVQRTKDAESGVDELLFLEPAIALGSEFAASWMWGTGLSVEMLSAAGIIAFAREFLAPTAISNHLFSVTKGPANLDLFTHFALTLDEYRQHMTGLLEQAGAKALEPLPVPPPAQSLPPELLPAAPPPMQSLPLPPLITELATPAPAILPSPTDVTLVRPHSATSMDAFVLTIKCEERRIAMTAPLRLGCEADNELVLSGEKVAPHHAIIQHQGLIYKIIDLNTDSGTFVNGKRITGPTLLKSGDIVLIGDNQLTISDQP